MFLKMVSSDYVAYSCGYKRETCGPISGYTDRDMYALPIYIVDYYIFVLA